MEKLLTPQEAADQLHVSTALLAQMRFRGVGPKYVRLSPRKILYTQDAISEYVVESTRQGTAAAS